MKRLTVLLLLALSLFSVRAENLGRSVTVTGHPDWKSVNPSEPGQDAPPFPTLKYIPKDGRNAAILVTLLPNDLPGFTVTDLESLTRFNLLSAQPYLADPRNPPAPTELKMRNALALTLTSEDPALIGKPAPPGEYKIATSASVLLARRFLIHCTIFYDEKGSEDLHQALEILRSAAAAPEPASPSLAI